MEKEEFRETLFDKIKVLNEIAWENRVNKPKIDLWLDNFGDDDDEKLHALYLLSKFTYFGDMQMRNLLKALYRDLFKYKMTAAIRRKLDDSLDTTQINNLFNQSLLNTRFLGIGNPSESGAHLLYFFRQENKLSKLLFINPHEIFKMDVGGSDTLILNNEVIENYIFLDDFCGSGSQVKSDKFLNNIIHRLKSLKKNVNIQYLMLIGTSEGINNVRNLRLFNEVEAVMELDDSFKCFNTNSRYFTDTSLPISKVVAHNIASKYGRPLAEDLCKREGFIAPGLSNCADRNKLGFNDCQLLLGFHHNTPDNTLPIFWYEEDSVPWNSIFKRYNKKYKF